MKTQKSLLAIAFLGATVLACNNAEKSTQEETTPAVEEASFVNEEGVLQSNNGAKWEANAETTNGVVELQAYIETFKELDVPNDLYSYQQLAAGMDETMKGIFDQCSMTGAAHDELHDFLVPIIGNIKTMGGDDLEAAKLALDELKIRLAEYDTFFE